MRDRALISGERTLVARGASNRGSTFESTVIGRLPSVVSACAVSVIIMESPPYLLSICMIVKNEESVIARALASAKNMTGCEAELVVVDTGSTDRTVAIAEELGAKVFHFTWINDFSAARNYAFACATGAWMMVLDADEELTQDFRDGVFALLRDTDLHGFRMPVIGIDDAGVRQMTLMSTRLVRNGHGYGYEGRVHEDVTPTILRAGGRMADTTAVSLVHYGYTAKETTRKDRHRRNIELLEAAHRTSPMEPRYWHYLGIELRAAGDLPAAASWFDRVLAKAPGYELAAWSASALSEIHEAEQDIGTAWLVVEGGLRGSAGRIHCLVRMGMLAVRDGDADTARWCADELERNPTDDLVSRAAGLERSVELRAAALVEKAAGSGHDKDSVKARDFLVAQVKKYPQNASLAELLVRVSEASLGRGRGAADAMKRAGLATVVAAAMNAAYQSGAYTACAELGDKTKVASEMWTFALAKLGRLDEARSHLVAFGERSALHALVFGLAHGDEAALAHAATALSALELEALGLVRAGTRVPARFAPFVIGWLRLAIGLREEGAATVLASALPWSVPEREAFRALLTFHSGDWASALARAMEYPTELASMEVIGLVAHRHGDYPGAAAMLSMRAKAGDASVRVHLKGADALLRLGRRAEAAQLLALGLESRPFSRALVAATGTKRAA